jgi:hypothetical protein
VERKTLRYSRRLFGSTVSIKSPLIAASTRWISALILIIPSLVIYPNVIRNEEAHLERLFPDDSRRNRETAPRFIPKLGRFVRSFSFKKYLANRE